MKAFLFELAEEIYQSHTDLSKVTVVFPNRRASLYFRKYLSDLIDKPVFSPRLLTFEDFVAGYSDLRVPDKLDLVFSLYQSYQELMKTESESFDQFFMWGEMLLKDFDEADRYMVDAKVLFADLSHLKELDSGLDYLSDEQKEFLQNFWQGFDEGQSANKKKFIDVWRRLYPLYKEFNEKLLNEGLAYEGGLHRSLADAVLNGKIKFNYSVSEKELWFAGFNALTKAEEKIIAQLVSQGMAQVRWDTDQYYLNDVKQEAGRFLREYKQDLVFGKTFLSDFPDHFRQNKNVELFGAAQPMGQVKLLAQILESRLKEGMVPEETVVILADEKLLMPVLHSIAPVTEKFNVTMGFPLASAPVYNLIELLVDLQISFRKDHFLFSAAQPVLAHPYVVAAEAALSHHKLKEIVKHNWVFIPLEFLASEVELHAVIFRKAEKITQYILEVLQAVMLVPTLDQLDKEYLIRSIQLLNRLDVVWGNEKTDNPAQRLKSFLRLFRQYAKGEKIPFTGEPLKGVQVMGVLESRNLDFKNIFVLSLNEGIFPSAVKQGSYIPFSIRKAYGLPTPEHQGAIYAYLFYRALQRSENVFLFYNSEPDVLGQGEMSRYLQQVIYESGLEIKENVLHNVIQPRGQSAIVIQKNEQVLRALAKLNEGNLRSRGLSPSALNTYIECQLRFYFQYVARIREAYKVEEEIDPRTLGNLLHTVMEQFYKRVLDKKKNKIIDADDFDGLPGRIDKLIDEAFIKTYHLDSRLEVTYEGQRVVVREVVRKFAKQILEYDKIRAPFKIEALEQNGWLYNIKISHAPGFASLGGTIDRIDSKGDEVRVIDYKTGKDELDFRNVASLFSREGSRNKAAFQTLLYALLYKNNNASTGSRIVPGLINRNNLFDDEFHFGLKMDKQLLADATPLFAEFEGHLQDLLEEIFDPAQTFIQTKKEDTCKLCPYKEICYR
ncbi:hypothetical protein WSM22_02250 [Cytophagales bacterium WSM2-2]|nr:hypothetical protein WSM22_02250 [Cytophagales bacterium WSM2-2]